MIFKSAYLSLIAGLLTVSAPLVSASYGCHDGCGFVYPKYTQLHGYPDKIASSYNLHQEVLNDIVTTCQKAVGTYTHGKGEFHHCSDWAVIGDALPPWTGTSINWKIFYVDGNPGDTHDLDQTTCVNLYTQELGGCQCGSVQKNLGMQFSWEFQYGTCEQNHTED
jgi:hypothetical protein